MIISTFPHQSCRFLLQLIKYFFPLICSSIFYVCERIFPSSVDDLTRYFRLSECLFYGIAKNVKTKCWKIYHIINKVIQKWKNRISNGNFSFNTNINLVFPFSHAGWVGRIWFLLFAIEWIFIFLHGKFLNIYERIFWRDL